MEDFILKNKNYIIIIIACLMLLMPILLVGSYDRPVADDYDYGLLTHEVVQKGGNLFDLIMAAIQTDLNFYNSWQGLYASAFILSLQPAIFGESFYALTCMIVLAIAFICLYFSMRILNKHYIKESNFFVFTYTLVILTILTLLLPSATEGLYWYNGAMNYMPWVFSNFLGICILIELFYTEDNMRYSLLLGFSMLLSFFTSGGNHVTGFANILFMLIATIFIMRKKGRFYPIFPLLCAIIGFILMYIAPGTGVRQNALQSLGMVSPSIGETFINTFQYVISMFMSWLNIQWILSLIIITPVSLLISKNIKEKVSPIIPVMSIICSLIVIGAMFAMPYYAMGNFGRPRLTNVVWITFIILSWVNYTLIICALEKNNIFSFDLITNSYKKLFLVIILLSLFLIFFIPQGDLGSNSYICLHELNNGSAEKFAVEMDDRINTIKSSNQDSIKLRPITPGSVLFFRDITNDPTQWPNTSMEKYYNKANISIQ